MANTDFLRQSKAEPYGSAAPALVSRLILLLLIGTASLLTLAAGLIATSRGPFGHGHQHVSFIERTVGAPAGPSLHRPFATGYASSQTRVTLHRNGATISHSGRTLELAAAGAGSARWQPRANGAIRPPPFGEEAIVTNGVRTENYLNIKSRVGVRTWRWHLGTAAQLARDGTVHAAGMTIRPPAIYDDHGTNVTPAGARWALARRGGVADLLLRLDDAHLPVPYLIDPEVDYGSTTSAALYLKLAASTYNKGSNGTSPGQT